MSHCTDSGGDSTGSDGSYRKQLLRQEEHLRVSIESLKKDLPSANEKLADTFMELGLCLYNQVRFSEAVDSFTSCLFYQPFLSECFYHRAAVHYRMSRWDLASRDLETAVSLSPFNSNYKLALTHTLSSSPADL